MRPVTFTPEAIQDIVTILAWSEEQFGPEMRMRYERLIDTAIDDVADDPDRLGSRPRLELREGIRTYHLEIVRVLHDAMELGQHLPDEDPGAEDD